jgi:hypothetical protein
MVWQHFVGGRTYPEIAREHAKGPSTVQEDVEYMIHHLPDSSKLDDHNGPIVELAKMIFSTQKEAEQLRRPSASGQKSLVLTAT